MTDRIKSQPPLQSDTEMFAAVRAILPSGLRTNVRLVDESLRHLQATFGHEVYSTFIHLMFHLSAEPREAMQLWEQIMNHHDQLRAKLGEEFDFRVSALDFLTREKRLIENPIVMETRRYVEVYQDTVTDAMTGLYNFRHFRDMLDRELSRADRYQSSLSLIFIDVDHFKKFNDRYGHQMGDRALQIVAGVIQHSVRTSDIPCRYGGEEFAIIAPETKKEGAILVAERIRRGVQSAKIAELPQLTGITISGGISVFPADALTGEDLLAKADETLYLAKQNGRNRIETQQGDRRRAPRFPIALPAVCAVLPERRASVSAKNISEGGLLIESGDPLPKGSQIQLEVELPKGKQPIRCVGKVAHVRTIEGREYFDVGVSITQMSAQDKGAFNEFLSTQKAA